MKYPPKWKDYTSVGIRYEGFLHYVVKKCAKQTQLATKGPEPEWPAIQLYDITTDKWRWYECDDPLLIRECNPGGRTNGLNTAALKLMEQYELS